jgi:hypothetical protein
MAYIAKRGVTAISKKRKKAYENKVVYKPTKTSKRGYVKVAGKRLKVKRKSIPYGYPRATVDVE